MHSPIDPVPDPHKKKTRWKNLSLKQKILLSVVIALSLGDPCCSWQSYTSQKSMLLQGSQEQVQRLGSQQAASVSDWHAARDVIQALVTRRC